MNTVKILDIVKSGGAIVLAAMLVWVVWSLVGNHIRHNTDALTELKESSIMETAAIGNLVDAIGEVKDTNVDLTKAIDRLNYLISNE